MGKDRSHSFAPGDRKERRDRKLAAVERLGGEPGPRRGEGVVAGARSILLIEDNLQPLVGTEVEQQGSQVQVVNSSPDIIQDLPREPERKEEGRRGSAMKGKGSSLAGEEMEGVFEPILRM